MFSWVLITSIGTMNGPFLKPMKANLLSNHQLQAQNFDQSAVYFSCLWSEIDDLVFSSRKSTFKYQWRTNKTEKMELLASRVNDVADAVQESLSRLSLLHQSPSLSLSLSHPFSSSSSSSLSSFSDEFNWQWKEELDKPNMNVSFHNILRRNFRKDSF